MKGSSWWFFVALGAASAALFGLFVGLLKVVDRLFVDYRADVARWEPAGFSDGGRTLTVRYSTSQCTYDPFDRVDRLETEDAVTLTVITRHPSGGDCDDVAVHHETKVELDDPLGARRLLDGRIGAPPDPHAPTTVPVRIRQVVDVSRGSYPYGFESFLRIRDPADGGRIRDLQLPEPARPTRRAYVSTLALRLRPDEYRFEVVQRPCEWTCENLGPSSDGCSVLVEARPLRPVELTAQVRPNHGCAITVR
ncbi:MAG TPA: hypothetical protein VD769_14535 [Gaiellaceae bacterium]|nr:hypothetical protein [Gaiellaceae bacterium]